MMSECVCRLLPQRKLLSENGRKKEKEKKIGRKREKNKKSLCIERMGKKPGGEREKKRTNES